MNRVSASLGSAFFLLVAPGIIAGVVPWWMSRWERRTSFPDILALKIAAVALIALGLWVLLDSFVRFALQGIGTPAPAFPTRHLVVSGLYRHVRNPIYVAVVALVLGQALLFAHGPLLVYGLLLWAGFHLFVVAYEEPTLQKTFGSEYETYRANVPRWLPRWQRWNASA
jgi:protein-S-isoprenylcysteine O-methyltransferase Ste14